MGGKSLLFLLFNFFLYTAFAQYKYSVADSRAILQKRNEEKQALKTRNQSSLLRVGQFYEKIYDKYHDTSMSAAVRAYTMSASTEIKAGAKDQPIAALQLAKIYETGKGVSADTAAALAWYQLSGDKYGGRLDSLADNFCTANTVVKSFNKKVQFDSLQITIDPFCNVNGDQVKSALAAIGEYARQHPEYSLAIFVKGKTPAYTASYTSWLSNSAFPARISEVEQQLIKTEGISRERIAVYDVPQWTNDSRYLLTVKVISEEARKSAAGTRTVNGMFTTKNNMCSASFLFKPTGEFYYEGGCEGRSSIAKGRYEMINKKIRVFQEEVPILYSLKTKSSATEGKIRFTIVDAENKPLPLYTLFSLAPEFSGDTVQNIKTVSTDKKGQITIDSAAIGFLSFERVDPKRLSNEIEFNWVKVSTLTQNDITVQFNYPAFCLQYPEVDIATVATTFLLKSDKELVDTQNNSYKKSN